MVQADCLSYCRDGAVLGERGAGGFHREEGVAGF